LLLLPVLAGTGCLSLLVHPEESHKAPEAPAARVPDPPARPSAVTPEEITEANAADKARALAAELDDEENQRPAAAPEPAAPPASSTGGGSGRFGKAKP
jgi:hypothetical protein